MRVHAMRVAAAEPRPMPSTFRCLVRVRVWTNVGRWCRRVGGKTCVDRRPACSGRQSPKEPTQRREDEEKRRKETGRRDEERDGNFGCQLCRQRATCGRCDSMAIRSYKERTPSSCQATPNGNVPNFALQIPSRLSVPRRPPNTQRRDNSNRQSLDCAVWIPLLAQLETLTTLPYLSSPNFISPPTIKLRLPCCRRIASAVLSIDSRHLRPLKPPNLVGTSPSQRLPVIPSIVSPTPPPSLPPLTTWSRRRKPGPCPSSTPDSSKARPWFGHCFDRDLHLR